MSDGAVVNPDMRGDGIGPDVISSCGRRRLTTSGD